MRFFCLKHTFTKARTPTLRDYQNRDEVYNQVSVENKKKKTARKT